MTTRMHNALLVIIAALLFTACSKKMHFSTSPIVPAANGSVKIKNDNNGNYSVAVKVTHLAPADRLTPPKKGYFVWCETSDGRTRNIGQLKSSSGLFSKTLKAQLNTVTAFKPVRFFITGEDNTSVTRPGDLIVLDTK